MERSAWSAAFIAREGVGGERKSPAHVCVWGGGRDTTCTRPRRLCTWNLACTRPAACARLAVCKRPSSCTRDTACTRPRAESRPSPHGARAERTALSAKGLPSGPGRVPGSLPTPALPRPGAREGPGAEGAARFHHRSQLPALMVCANLYESGAWRPCLQENYVGNVNRLQKPVLAQAWTLLVRSSLRIPYCGALS